MSAPTGFINYPAPIAHDNIPYKAPPPGKNPVVKGLVLHYLSYVVTSAPLIPSILWSNAGFNSLRTLKELDSIEARFDPTVTPIISQEEKVPGSYTSASNLRTPPSVATDSRFHTIADFHNAYKIGTITPTHVIETLLPLIRRDVQTRSPHSTAFVDTKVEAVRSAAEASTKRWKEGKPLGVLDGVPFAIKDEMDFEGYKRYCGTGHDYTEGKETLSSWCAQKVAEEGAVFVGKLNMHELGLDTTNNNLTWGTPLNPYNNKYYCGGSSGGAAYAVASGLVPFAIGSDGGGSIRIPSNFCGLYGLKPSHGRVSTAPLIQSANTTVVQGPLASNMVDLEISYRVLAQPDPSHPVSRQFSPPRPLLTPHTKILGLCRPWFDRAEPAVQEACHSALEFMVSELGYRIIDIDIPFTHEGQLAHAMTILSEAATAQPTTAGLSPANKVLITVAQRTPARDFLLAQRLRNLLMQHLASLFTAHPGLIIVTPTTPTVGWPIGEGELAYGVTDGNRQVRTMEYVWLANFTGVPCLQFPVGYVEGVQGKGKVPVGIMGHGEWGSEDSLIEFGFDGERYVSEGLEGERLRPEVWVDVLKI